MRTSLEPTLTALSASLHLDIKPLLGGGIHEQLRPKVTPVLDDIKSMAEGKHHSRNGREWDPTGSLLLPRITLPLFSPDVGMPTGRVKTHSITMVLFYFFVCF